MMTNVYTKEERNAIANTIWRSLGSQKFSAMTGCTPLYYGESDGKVYIHMKVGRNCHSINRLEVAYNEWQDLFEMKFIRSIKGIAKVVASYKEVYVDMLHTLFTQHTGMVTEMPKLIIA